MPRSTRFALGVSALLWFAAFRPAAADDLLHAKGQASPAHGLSYKLAGGSETWDPTAKDRIVKSMDEAVAIYNANGNFDKVDTAAYSPGTPTADSNFAGWIRFGGMISTRVALHEIAHSLGVGTAPNWGKFAVNGVFTGKYATEMLRSFDGPTAVLHCDRQHIWPYGLNFDSEGGPTNFKRNVRMVAAIRVDLGLATPASLLSGDKLVAAARRDVTAAKADADKADAAVVAAARRSENVVDGRPEVIAANRAVATARAAESTATTKAVLAVHQTDAYRSAQAAAATADRHLADARAASTDVTGPATAAMEARQQLTRLEARGVAADPGVVRAKQARVDATNALAAARAAAAGGDDPALVDAKAAAAAAHDRVTAAERSLADAQVTADREKAAIMAVGKG
jgi:hypothetical protein